MLVKSLSQIALLAALVTDLQAGSPLEELRQRWAGLLSVELVASTRVVLDHSPNGVNLEMGVTSRAATDRDGRLAYEFSSELYENGVLNEASSQYSFRYVDPKLDTARISEPSNGGLFIEYVPILTGYDISHADVPDEALLAHWPLLGLWLDRAMDDPDAELHETGAGAWSYTMPSLRMRMEFTSDGWLAAVTKWSGKGVDAGVVLRNEFVRDAQTDDPASIRQIITRRQGDDVTPIADTTFTVTSFQSLDHSPDAWFAFDQTRLNTLRFDRKSGDVYDLDGKVLYNRYEIERRLRQGDDGWLPGPTRAWQIGSVTLLLLIGVSAQRRRSPGGPI
ncbi:MAG: hypothetical protein ACIARR_08450 [Phycisphaerales bacterium JB059]